MKKNAGRALTALKKVKYILPGCLLFMAAAAPCQAKLNVFVSILPQAYFAQRLGGADVMVSVLVGPGQSPHAFEPTPRQVAALSQADIFFKIGLPFEERLLQKMRGASDRMRVVDTRRGIRLRALEEQGGHSHGQQQPEPGQEKEMPDPHIWLAPKLIRQQAQTMCDGLCAQDAARCDGYRRNCSAFQAELDALDAELSSRLAPFAGREIFVFHPALGYFTDAYRLMQVPIEMAGKEPGSKSFANLVARARLAGVKTIFAERQFSPKSAQAVAQQIGAGVEMIDPLAPDCFQNLREIAEKIEKMK